MNKLFNLLVFVSVFSFAQVNENGFVEDLNSTEIENGVFWRGIDSSSNQYTTISRTSEGVELSFSNNTTYYPTAFVEFGFTPDDAPITIDISEDQSYSYTLTNNGDSTIIVRFLPVDNEGNSVLAKIVDTTVEPWWYIVEDTLDPNETLSMSCGSYEGMVDIDWNSGTSPLETIDLMEREQIVRFVLTISNYSGHLEATPLPLVDYSVTISQMNVSGVSCPDDGTVVGNDNFISTFSVTNPINDVIEINTTSEVYATHLYGIEGELIAQGNSSTINSDKLPSGLYILEVLTSSGKEVVKLIKE